MSVRARLTRKVTGSTPCALAAAMATKVSARAQGAESDLTEGEQ
jgi:hypothetical protein